MPEHDARAAHRQDTSMVEITLITWRAGVAGVAA
jgi:hypothetical protein